MTMNSPTSPSTPAVAPATAEAAVATPPAAVKKAPAPKVAKVQTAAAAPAGKKPAKAAKPAQAASSVKPAKAAKVTKAAPAKPVEAAKPAKPAKQAKPVKQAVKAKVVAPAKAPASVKAPKAPKVAKAAKVKPAADAAQAEAPKVKLVRDSFTMPELEYTQLSALKRRALGLAHHVKKSELLRAGIATLAAMNDETLLAALQAVPPLKTGRPKSA
jgi:hypothetical protein